MNDAQFAIIQEVLSVLEGAAESNAKLFRTVLSHTQQDRANRLREAFNIERKDV